MIRSFRTIEFEKEKSRPLKCPHCGQLLTKGKVICKHCQGQSGKEKIENAEHNKETVCPNCKALNEKENVTCKSCGSNFVQARMQKYKENSESKKK
ncbi:MAG: hypothetical protein FK733_09240 [Asgard group archaeon]|nr:hypothetical protein [Asgard group archaeon]